MSKLSVTGLYTQMRRHAVTILASAVASAHHNGDINCVCDHPLEPNLKPWQKTCFLWLHLEESGPGQHQHGGSECKRNDDFRSSASGVGSSGVAYGRIKQLRSEPAAKAVVKRAVTCLRSSSSQVAQQAGETMGVLLAQLKQAEASAAESATAPAEVERAGLAAEARDALTVLLNDPSKCGRWVHRPPRHSWGRRSPKTAGNVHAVSVLSARHHLKGSTQGSKRLTGPQVHITDCHPHCHHHHHEVLHVPGTRCEACAMHPARCLL